MTTVATENSSPFETRAAEQRHQVIRRDLNKLGRHDWSFWVLALTVIICLTGAVATLSFSDMSQPTEAFYEFHARQSIRGLIGLVLLFSFYTLYQQVQLRRTRARLAEQIGISAEQEIRAEGFLKLAMLDPVTGLHNRRYALERLASDVARARRSGSSLAVLVLDIDNFKQINDRYGHAAGDLALEVFGERMIKAIRGSDLATRIGGDEFLILLPDCDGSQVHCIADRLSGLEIEFKGENISFAFSAGLAGYRAGETVAGLIERADQALYAQKQKRKASAAIG